MKHRCEAEGQVPKLTLTKGMVIMSTKDEVLKAMREAGKPVSAGEIEKLTGLDRKEIDKAFKELKKENIISSPIRCKWEPIP